MGVYQLLTYADSPKVYYWDDDYEEVLARVSIYSTYEPGEKPRNHEGKWIRGKEGVALSEYWEDEVNSVFIPGFGELPVNDKLPSKSNKKHYAKARSKGKKIALVIDLRYDAYLTKKQKENRAALRRFLRKKDLGYQKVWIKRR